MNEDEVRELLRSSATSYRTLRATIDSGPENPLVWVRSARRMAERSDLYPIPRWWLWNSFAIVAAVFSRLRRRRVYRTKIWIEGSRRRIERSDGSLEIDDGVMHLSRDSDSSASICRSMDEDLFAGDLLLMCRPMRLADATRFVSMGTEHVAGRAAVTVEARATSVEADLFRRYDVYELGVDEERGVLVRLATRLGGKVAHESRIVEIAFDEPLSPDLFDTTPAPGEQVIDHTTPPVRPSKRSVSLTEARRLMSFELLVPPGWQVDAKVRGNNPQGVTLEIERDGTRASLSESLEDDDWLFRILGFSLVQRPRRLKIRGRKIEVRGFADSPIVELSWRGTEVRLSSEELGVDELIDLAASLEPMP